VGEFLPDFECEDPFEGFYFDPGCDFLDDNRAVEFSNRVKKDEDLALWAKIGRLKRKGQIEEAEKLIKETSPERLDRISKKLGELWKAFPEWAPPDRPG